MYEFWTSHSRFSLIRRAFKISVVSVWMAAGLCWSWHAEAYNQIWLGATLSGGLQSPLGVSAFQSATGHKVNIVSLPMPWSAGAGLIPFNGSVLPWARAIAATGALPMVTWEPETYVGGAAPIEGACPNQLGTLSSSSPVIQFLHQYAQQVAAYGKPILIRPMHEMNMAGWVWSVGPNPYCGYVSASDFISAWRRIVTIFHLEKAYNAKFVWCVNWASIGTLPGSVTVTYPGDAYVAYASIDGYNFGGTAWHSFDEIFRHPYNAVVAKTQKPILIAEWASAESGGSKANWIKSAFASVKANKYPHLKGLVWFDEYIPDQPPWPVTSSAASAAAYRSSVVNLP